MRTTKLLLSALLLSVGVAYAGPVEPITVENPEDYTSYIVNPTVDGQTGWTCERPRGGNGPMLGGAAFEYWAGNASNRQQASFDYWQSISLLPQGVYRVGVEMGNSLNGEVGATVFEPTCGAYANEFYCYVDENSDDANSGKQLYRFLAIVGPEGTMRLGVKTLKTPMVARWFVADNFELTYYGDTPDAYGTVVEQLQRLSTIEDLQYVTRSLRTEYENLVSSVSAETREEYYAVEATILEKKAEVEENAALWNQYVELTAQAKDLCDDPAYASVTVDLKFEVVLAQDAIEDLILNSVDLSRAIVLLQELYNEARNHTPNDTDVTHFIVNNDFSQGWTGWTSASATDGNVAANASARCAEAWNNSGFNIFQDIENSPVGVYEIQVQGFYRYLRGDNAWNAYFNEDGTPKTDKPQTPAFVYLNDAKTPMANVFEYQVPVEDNYYTATGDLAYYTDPRGAYVYPNSMADAGLAFDHGAYKVSAFGLVAKEGEVMRIGMRGSSNQGNDSWAIFTRFRLVFRGTNPDYVKPFLIEKLPTIDLATLAEKSNVPAQFIGKDVADSITAVKAEAEAALAANDGEAMFAALAKVLACGDMVDYSIELFKTVYYSLANFESAVDDAVGARASLIAEIRQFIADKREALEARTLTDDDARNICTNIRVYERRLTIPEYFDQATSESPVELTYLVLANPSFEEVSLNGWVGLGGEVSFSRQYNTAFGKEGSFYAECWHKAGSIDMYQELNLPPGRYVLEAKAYCYDGDAVIYAKDQEVAIENNSDPLEPQTIRVPFEVDYEQYTLRAGIKGELSPDSWICVDDFRLYYLGTDHYLLKPVLTENPVFDAQTVYYLYDIDANAFALGANDWTTRASVSTGHGYKFVIEPTGNGLYALIDSVETQGAWRYLYEVDADGVWVDGQGEEANIGQWKIIDVNWNYGPGMFAFRNVDGNIGVSGDPQDTRLYLSEEHYDYWGFVSESDYASYIERRTAFCRQETEVGIDIVDLAPADWVGATGRYVLHETDAVDHIYRAERYDRAMYVGDVMTQTIEGLVPGTKYEVTLEAAASYTPGRGFGGATGLGLTVLFANEGMSDIEVVEREATSDFGPYTVVGTVDEDGTLTYGLKNVAEGGNWFVVRVLSVKVTDKPVNVVTLTKNLNDGEEYANRYYSSVNVLNYSRTFNNTQWQALYVPFSIPVDTLTAHGLEVARLNDTHMYDEDEDGVFEKTTIEFLRLKSGETRFNYPYLIRASEVGTVTLSLPDCLLAPAVHFSIDCSTVDQLFSFSGTYTGVSGETMFNNNYYALGGGQLARVSSPDVSLKPQRWYMQIENRDGSPVQYYSPTIRVVVDGEEEEPNVNAIESIHAEEAVVRYNLNGVRQQTKSGAQMSVKNGRIVFEK